MKAFNEKDWVKDKNLIARRIDAGSLPGLLKKRLHVPALCKVLVTMPSGEKVIRKEGSEVTGLKEAVLVKTHKFDLPFSVTGLVTSEGFVGECELLLAFIAGEGDFDVEQVAENLLKGRQEATTRDVGQFLSEAVEETLKTFASEHTAGSVCEQPVISELSESLEKGLKKLLYLGGLSFCGVAEFDFVCPEFESLQSERSKIKGREEVLRSRAKLDEMQLQSRLVKIQALKEVGVDPNVALEIELGKAGFAPSRSKMLLVASGKGIYAYAPYSQEPAKPEEIYLLPEDMGFARTARVLKRDGELVIAVGTQRGVYVFSPGGDYSHEYYIKTTGRPRGGFNSAALAGDVLYATHSELGILRWEGDGEGEAVLTKITSFNRHTRGVCAKGGTVYFSSGSFVHAFDPVSVEVLFTLGEEGSPITSLLVEGDSIFAGNQAGEVLHWAGSQPERPASVLLRRQSTIYSLSTMDTDKGTFLLVGSRDYSVTAFEPITGAARQYMSPALLRWVDGAGDFVFAASYSGHRVFAWDVREPSRHLYSIPVEEKAQDIRVWEVK